jgi:E3 UFM1-protein ligase 1
LGYTSNIDAIVSKLVMKSKVKVVGRFLMTEAVIAEIMSEFDKALAKDGCIDLISFSETNDVPLNFIMDLAKSRDVMFEATCVFNSTYYSARRTAIVEYISYLTTPTPVKEVLEACKLQAPLHPSNHVLHKDLKELSVTTHQGESGVVIFTRIHSGKAKSNMFCQSFRAKVSLT